MVICSAPGKIYLFGEHAVVYGKDAICCAIDLRTWVTATKSSGTTILSSLGVTGLDFDIHPYISTVVEEMRKLVSFTGIAIKVDSNIPVGSGLGSSAAVTVATIGALNYLFECNLTHNDIAKLGHKVEMKVQNNASLTDTYVSTHGGVIKMSNCKKLPLIECGVVIGNTNKLSSTKEIVNDVSMLRLEYPQLIDQIINIIGELPNIGEKHLEKKNYGAIGELMNINHGLLDSLGVNVKELSNLVYATRSAGAYGSKTTGAGGGGCMFSLTSKDHVDNISKAIIANGGDSLITNTTNCGVNVESKYENC